MVTPNENQAIPVISSFEENINVVYIDLFGFSAFLKNAESANQSRPLVIYKRVDVILQKIVVFIKNSPYTIFASDSLFCCFSDEEAKTTSILSDLAQILWQFLVAGFTFSGGISRGRMQRKEKFLIGYPMVEAVRTQENQFLPRIAFAKPESCFPWVNSKEVWQESGVSYFDYFQFLTTIPVSFSKIADLCAMLIDDADVKNLSYYVLAKYDDFLARLSLHLSQNETKRISNQRNRIRALLGFGSTESE